MPVMNRRSLVRALGAVALTGLTPLRALAQTLPPDLAALSARGKLVVGMTEADTPPFFSGPGEPHGIDVDIAHAIGAALELPVEFNRGFKTFNDVVNGIALGTVDLATSKISRTFKRSRLVSFSKPYVQLRHALMFNRLRLAQAARGRDVADVTRTFEGSIGVVTGSAWVTFAHEHFPHAKVVEFETWPEVIAAAVSGSVDAGYRDEFEVRRIAIDQPDSAINLRTVAIADARDFISVAVPWTAPQVLAIVDQVIDALPQPYTADLLIDLYRAQSGAAVH